MNKLYEVGDKIIFHDISIQIRGTYNKLNSAYNKLFLQTHTLTKPTAEITSCWIDDEGCEMYSIIVENEYRMTLSRHFLEEHSGKIPPKET